MGKVDLRKDRLLYELDSRERLSVPEIQSLLKVSASTARRLCISLEDDGKAVRVLGGVQKRPDPPSEARYSYDANAVANVAEKERIGSYAGNLVKNGDILYLTGGTTVFQLVLSLRERIRAGELQGVVIMTNSLVNAEALADTSRVLLTGGEFRPERRDMAGYLSEQNIRSARFSKCFTGVDGIDIGEGLMALDMDTANMDHLAAAQSDEVFILTDHTKFIKRSFIVFQRFSQRHTVITDSGLEPDYVQRAGETGLNLIVV